MSTQLLQEHERVFDQLIRYLDGELEDAETAAVAAHLDQCATCRRRLAELLGIEQVYAHELTQGEPSSDYRARLQKRLRGDRGARRYDLVTVADLKTRRCSLKRLASCKAIAAWFAATRRMSMSFGVGKSNR